jgi:hypothetical protein
MAAILASCVLGDLIGKTTSRSVSVGRKVADARRYLAVCHVGGWSDLTMIPHDSWSIRLLFAAESCARCCIYSLAFSGST